MLVHYWGVFDRLLRYPFQNITVVIIFIYDRSDLLILPNAEQVCFWGNHFVWKTCTKSATANQKTISDELPTLSCFNWTVSAYSLCTQLPWSPGVAYNFIFAVVGVNVWVRRKTGARYTRKCVYLCVRVYTRTKLNGKNWNRDYDGRGMKKINICLGLDIEKTRSNRIVYIYIHMTVQTGVCICGRVLGINFVTSKKKYI